MSFIREVRNARREGFEKSVKEIFDTRQKEMRVERQMFEDLIFETTDQINEIKTNIINAAKQGKHSYVILDNFSWFRHPYFNTTVDLEGAKWATSEFLTTEASSLGFNYQWLSTYKKLSKGTIQDKGFLRLWELFESLGLDPYFDTYVTSVSVTSVRFCVRF